MIQKLSDVQIGNFIRFSDKDKKGKYHYTGEVIDIKDKFIMIETFYGIMGFTINTENELSIDEKPSGWEKFKKDPIKFKKELKEKEIKKDIAPPIKTQKELILDFVKENKNLTKSKLLKMAKNNFKDISEHTLLQNIELALIKLS